jgi:hypothetical protein
MNVTLGAGARGTVFRVVLCAPVARHATYHGGFVVASPQPIATGRQVLP